MTYKVIEALIENGSEDIVDTTDYDDLKAARRHYREVIRKYLEAEGNREIDIQIAVGEACSAHLKGEEYVIECLDMKVYIEE